MGEVGILGVLTHLGILGKVGVMGVLGKMDIWTLHLATDGLRGKVKASAASCGETMQGWVVKAIEERLRRGRVETEEAPKSAPRSGHPRLGTGGVVSTQARGEGAVSEGAGHRRERAISIASAFHDKVLAEEVGEEAAGEIRRQLDEPAQWGAHPDVTKVGVAVAREAQEAVRGCRRKGCEHAKAQHGIVRDAENVPMLGKCMAKGCGCTGWV